MASERKNSQYYNSICHAEHDLSEDSWDEVLSQENNEILTFIIYNTDKYYCISRKSFITYILTDYGIHNPLNTIIQSVGYIKFPFTGIRINKKIIQQIEDGYTLFYLYPSNNDIYLSIPFNKNVLYENNIRAIRELANELIGQYRMPNINIENLHYFRPIYDELRGNADPFYAEQKAIDDERNVLSHIDDIELRRRMERELNARHRALEERRQELSGNVNDIFSHQDLQRQRLEARQRARQQLIANNPELQISQEERDARFREREREIEEKEYVNIIEEKVDENIRQFIPNNRNILPAYGNRPSFLNDAGQVISPISQPPDNDDMVLEEEDYDYSDLNIRNGIRNPDTDRPTILRDLEDERIRELRQRLRQQFGILPDDEKSRESLLLNNNVLDAIYSNESDYLTNTYNMPPFNVFRNIEVDPRVAVLDRILNLEYYNDLSRKIRYMQYIELKKQEIETNLQILNFERDKNSANEMMNNFSNYMNTDDMRNLQIIEPVRLLEHFFPISQRLASIKIKIIEMFFNTFLVEFFSSFRNNNGRVGDFNLHDLILCYRNVIIKINSQQYCQTQILDHIIETYLLNQEHNEEVLSIINRVLSVKTGNDYVANFPENLLLFFRKTTQRRQRIIAEITRERQNDILYRDQANQIFILIVEDRVNDENNFNGILSLEERLRAVSSIDNIQIELENNKATYLNNIPDNFNWNTCIQFFMPFIVNNMSIGFFRNKMVERYSNVNDIRNIAENFFRNITLVSQQINIDSKSDMYIYPLEFVKEPFEEINLLLFNQ